jgi:hypothetical protein
MKLRTSLWEKLFGLSDKDAMIDKLPISEVKRILHSNEVLQNNNHNWDMYCATKDSEFLDSITDNDYITDLSKYVPGFHGCCHGCQARDVTIKNCLTCAVYPPNREFLWESNKRHYWDKPQNARYIE